MTPRLRLSAPSVPLQREAANFERDCTQPVDGTENPSRGNAKPSSFPLLKFILKVVSSICVRVMVRNHFRVGQLHYQQYRCNLRDHAWRHCCLVAEAMGTTTEGQCSRSPDHGTIERYHPDRGSDYSATRSAPDHESGRPALGGSARRP